ncbi:NAD-glutamate dehydrogenase [Pararhizobium haloflavum]|uniref:NAD-glutamate dehydrogenase n=1 Tax=Pararhizobium haloflavum TaxID=2037914 RepID=UPI000C191EA3|nr:NAD-glutamate dehydrogenase [Pararhizobium haloflavum]
MGARRNPRIDRKIADARSVLAQRKSDDAIDPAVLFGRVAYDDLDAYDGSELAMVARHAHAEVNAFDGKSARISVVSPTDLSADGQQVSIISVTDRNMPFLYDSIVGEISAAYRTIFLAMHPILCRGEDGGLELFSSSRPCPPSQRISHVQIHVPVLSDEQGETLREKLKSILEQVHAAVGDWKPMLSRLDRTMTLLEEAPASGRKAERAEALAFLRWLRDDNFTFLGMREYVYSSEDGEGKVERAREKGLGILADPDIRVLRLGKDHVTTTPEILAFLEGPDSLIVTKANMRSMVHRRAYMDYIGVKLYGEDGTLAGELRIVGLFTSTAYTRSVADIPLLRMKVDAVVSRLGFDPESHSGKMLFNTLESYPRDDLFQTDVETLTAFSMQLNELADRPRVRVLPRIDRFDRFVSVIVYVPRDQYDSDVRERIGLALADHFDGHVSAYYPAFPEGNLARVHFIIGRAGGKTPRVAQDKLERHVRTIVTRWEDRFDLDRPLGTPMLHASEAYRERYTPSEAIADLADLQACNALGAIRIELSESKDGETARLTLKIFHAFEPVALSRRVPLLENLGFNVISEQTFDLQVKPDKGPSHLVVLHEMELEPADVASFDLAATGPLVEHAFLEAWHGRIDDDRFNRLVVSAGLTAEQVVVLRAYGRYMRQLGSSYSQDYIARVLNRYPALTRKLFELFRIRFDPDMALDQRTRRMETARKVIAQALGDVTILEEDRILRRYENAILATLRTNYHQRDAAGDARPTLALKINPRALDSVPEPKPFREIFVYGAEVEGVHMRFGPVARGGLRWSDRPEDYRTEVLGLVKAQQVKNAVIVPVGAKGGFFPKRLPMSKGRDAVFDAGRDAYKTFIRTLLSVTDNIVDGAIVPPDKTIRHDGDDPYFVVAADKGTATFSDTANAISQEHDFWLDDAFASGGSAGYDHKKMGITARGAWEAVKRHFREMDIDIQTTPFTVVGVGDMSGDVFGNGMLLSRQIRLLAAFDHRDIVIDPDPDPATSFKERKRLFGLGRSSWQDYNRDKLSPGGMVISRSEKSVKLTAAAAAAIGLDKSTASPPEIISAILKAPADLLWFGGIGTYVKAADESDADVGDRTNDGIRITAGEVGARVIGEGANLGVTQKGRIAYGLAGGRCNSDAIDNSAGVNSSDVEVNIKIALASAMKEGRLSRADRDKLLVSMTDEVAALVLRNNYLQSLAISLTERRGSQAAGELGQLMLRLEEEGRLDRKVETLPAPQVFAERYAAGKPLTRAEIGVLLSYAKIGLFDDLTASSLPADPYFETTLGSYFPRAMREGFDGDIANHRLRREIVATLLANDAINRGGPGFVSYFADASGALPANTIKAFVIARDGLQLNDDYDQIDALDTKLPGDVQNRLYQMVGDTLRGATGWALRSSAYNGDLKTSVTALRDAAKRLKPILKSLIPPFLKEEAEARLVMLLDAGVPDRLAKAAAMLPTLAHVPEMAEIAVSCDTDVEATARQYFAVTDAFRIGRIEAAARRIDTADHYTALALARNLDEISVARRAITSVALSRFGKEANPVEAWIRNDKLRISRVRGQILALAEGGDFNVARLTVAAGMMADLARGENG